MAVIKQFGRKAFEFAMRNPRDDKFITLLEGSIRSGKTFSFHPKIIRGLCTYEVQGLRVIVGVSKQTVKDNLLRDLFEIVGEKNYYYNSQTGELRLFNKDWLVIGAKDEGSEKYLRGKTIGIAIVEEAVLIPESFFMQLLGRLSPANARLYANTNPDSPRHYLRTKVMENKQLAGRIEVIHFDLEDNPNISRETKERYRASFTGVFYDRFILGKWVAAEGSIYGSAWNEELNTYDDSTMPRGLRARGGHVDNFISVDCGTDHPQVYLKWFDDGVKLYIDEEYVWDSEIEHQQKTNGEYAKDLKKFMGDDNCLVIVPPECLAFKTELTNMGIVHIDADNDVKNGIEVVSSLLFQRKLLVHKRCTRTINAIPDYIWDKKASERGEEQPVKKKDDEVDTVRYGAKTKTPSWRLAA